MKVEMKTYIDAVETDTKGDNAYVVGLLCGGVMEDPEFHYEKPYQIIRANNEQEAVRKYNEINNCSYYYGSVMGRC